MNDYLTGGLIYTNQPPILPQCTFITRLDDPLLLESNFNSSPVIVDGKITYPSEWTQSRCYQLRLNAQLQSAGCGSGSTSIASKWFFSNDEQRLYLLINFKEVDFAPEGIHFSYYYPYPLSGEWQFSDSMAIASQAFDHYGWRESQWSHDVDDGGTLDTRARSYQDGQSYWFELSKPLDSGDGHDWSWQPGERVGTDLTGDLMIGDWGVSSVIGDSYGCRLIQLQLAK